MAVIIRLSKMGRKGEARYRLVVSEKRSRRNGRPIETLGWFEKTVKGNKNEINRTVTPVASQVGDDLPRARLPRTVARCVGDLAVNDEEDDGGESGLR